MVASLHTKRYELFRSLLVATRKAKALTQVELADRLNCHQSFISKYENGERRLDVTEFVDIAQALGINPCELLVEYYEKLKRL